MGRSFPQGEGFQRRQEESACIDIRKAGARRTVQQRTGERQIQQPCSVFFAQGRGPVQQELFAGVIDHGVFPFPLSAEDIPPRSGIGGRHLMFVR